MLTMAEEGSEQRVMTSPTVANKLGISRSRLNQLAPLYEQVFGELPRGGGHVRLWTPEAIEHIRSARLAVEEGRAVNMGDALRGFETPEEAQSSQTLARKSGERPEIQASPRAPEDLAAEVHALREAIRDQSDLLHMLLRVEAHRLKHLETDSPLPVATVNILEKAYLESAEGTGSSAENEKDREDTRPPSTGRRISTWVLLIMLPIPPILIAVMSALMMDTLLFAASSIAAGVTLLFSWYYYSDCNERHRAHPSRHTNEPAEATAQKNEQTGHRDSG
jgi:hypothetical protein